MLAFGLLFGVHTNAATPVERAVVLASFDSVVIPNSPVDEELWWFGRSGSHRSERPEAPRLTYADAAVARPMIGPGGWLIGNGEDAAEGCAGSACNGRAGGLLWGDGGNGARGGEGGNGGLFGGDGGRGGDGVLPGQNGGDGGSAGLLALVGDGGDGGNGADGALGIRGGDGGAGGAAGLLYGDGGDGGDGGAGGSGLDGMNPAAAGQARTGNPNYLGSTGLPYSNTVQDGTLLGRDGGQGADGAVGSNQSGGAGGQGQGTTSWFSAPHTFNVSGSGGAGGTGAGGPAGGAGGAAEAAAPAPRTSARDGLSSEHAGALR